jgi:hypothetical protein
MQRLFVWFLSFFSIGAAVMEANHMAQEPAVEPSSNDTVLEALVNAVRILDRDLPHGPENPAEPVRAADDLMALVSGDNLETRTIDELAKRAPGVTLYSIKVRSDGTRP